ncbi:hypothetical protein [Flexivirga alba]|uniref:Uncharacterized protein n=1 Tax=Flexivirga alba TaxID=702742 RepID=A0ABW2ACU9_9MICO
MEFRGVLPEDAPDPRIKQRRRLREMPVPVVGLAGQPSLEDTDLLSFIGVSDDAGYAELCVSVTYTLLRNPADRSDPVNLAELDEKQRAAIVAVPPRPRPAWLIEEVQRRRYPQLREAVRTSWSRARAGQVDLAQRLADHANDVLNNHYRQPTGPEMRWASYVNGAEVRRSGTVLVDGVSIATVEIDTDSLVYAVGARTGPHTVVTAVLPRSELKYLDIAFTTRSTKGPPS